MKKNKIALIGLLLACSLTFKGCADWLSVDPKEGMTEVQAFSSELLTNSVLNGMYGALAHTHLYGQYLTQTFIEYLARYYYWRPGDTQADAAFNYWGQTALFNYRGHTSTRYRIQNIWNRAYETIMSLNVFIERVEAMEAGIIRESRRNVLLGEAYALRAFLHFDIFRLFGPIHLNDEHVGLPYNNTTEVVPHDRLPAAQFIQLVQQDLDRAVELLENDPVRTRGANDNFVAIMLNITLSPEDVFAEYFRNRRMNYFAVRALQARVWLHIGEHAQAIAAAQATLDAIRENDSFRWETDRVLIERHRNFVFHREILFGINSANLHEQWVRLFDGTQPGQTTIVSSVTLYHHLFADFPGEALAAMSDIRALQWRRSSVADLGFETYISTKFREPSHIVHWGNVPYFPNLQPLIRMSELYLIMAEAHLATDRLTEAAHWLNTLMSNRGMLPEQLIGWGGAEIMRDDVFQRLRREVYKEFVGEGQAFFFLKRNNMQEIFSGRLDANFTTITPRNVFILPLPDSETTL